ncbi:MAG TPA: hypothetical protein VLL05_22645 [Terriglobales bacterium]|nr:hypothetical protein [Terriglobales bacterium]
MAETGVHFALDLPASCAEALKNPSPGRFGKEDVVSATHQQQWSVGGPHSRSIPRKELFDVLVFVPTWPKHFIGGE